MTGWGEAGFMERFGVPAVYFGSGDPKFSHTPEERCLTARIRNAMLAYLQPTPVRAASGALDAGRIWRGVYLDDDKVFTRAKTLTELNSIVFRTFQ